MANKGEKAGEIMAGRKKEVSIVAEDQNWRSYISNELKCAEIWNSDWGFLSSKGGGKKWIIFYFYRSISDKYHINNVFFFNRVLQLNPYKRRANQEIIRRT